MLYFFSEYSYRGNHAGTKARNDVEDILRQVSAKPINASTVELRCNESDEHIYSNVKNRFDLMRLFLEIRKIKNQTVIIQYPMLAFDFQEKYFTEIAKHNKLVLLIHDLHCLRIPNEEKLKQEVSMLNIAAVLIVHNRFMAQKVKSLGVNVSQIYCLEMFDYLCFGSLHQKHCEKKSIAFAGNLGKSKFLLELVQSNPQIEFKFYGSGWDDKWDNKNAKYCGSFKPEIIPEKINAGFGLVWDGNSIIDGAGPLGEYTRINNPHKLSLYLVAGIPVIVWEKAAVAEFVEKYNVGITVDRIDNLSTVLDNISEQKYEDMKQNTIKIREKLVSGGFLKDILNQL